MDKLIKSMTLQEKIALVSGYKFMFTNPIPRLSIPSIRVSDGPHGLRVQTEGGDNGVTSSLPSTSFPTAATSSNSFNPSLLKKMGNAMAMEAKYYGIDVILGPGVNIKRNPLCGRNFEYFSEDPFLSYKLGAALVDGIQEKGIGACLKHFALNNSENYRYLGNSICDERAMREIYLKQFERIVKESKPECIMSAYNQINNEYASENKMLLNDILRSDWGFNGLVMTDWGANCDRVKGIKAGQDLEMPGDSKICRKWLNDAIKDGSLDELVLDKAVLNVLNLIQKHQDKELVEEIDWETHSEISKNIAIEGAVLLKNENVLPLNRNEEILVVGELFEKMRYQGSGSSMINPTKLISVKDAFDENNIKYKYLKGYKENSLLTNPELIEEVKEASKEHQKILLFLGLTDYVESESGDRSGMMLPNNQIDLVNALASEGKDLIVVLFGGSVVELPFYNDVKGILNMFLPGQLGGAATFSLLFGLSNPSGRLAETWPISYKDVPFGNDYSKTKTEIYKESIFVGYRYYLTKEREVRFPFGYGLSYTKFDYSNLRIKQNEKGFEVQVDITNIGKVKGKEVVQFYVSKPNDIVFNPKRELMGFDKIELEPNESKEVTINIDYNDLRIWAIKEKRFVLLDGIYKIQIGKNSLDIVLENEIKISGEIINNQYLDNVSETYKNANLELVTNEVFEKMSGLTIPQEEKKKPITLESRFTDLKQTFMGRVLFNAILSVAKKTMREALKMEEGVERDNKIKGAMFLTRVLESNSLRSLSMSSSGAFSYNIACGFRDLANGHLIKGIKSFTKKIDAPKLPLEEEKK